MQIDGSLSRNYSGTGLGLVLVKKFVEMHNGDVAVSSEVSKGSCFTVTLPLITALHLNNVEFTHESTYQSLKSSILTESYNNHGSLNKILNQPLVLIADDNEINAELMNEFLTACNYKSIIARDGLEAVQFATEHKPQLIIIDIQMPKLDGLAAIKCIRKVPELAKTPIIVLTALSVFNEKNQCFEAGADELISKPVSLKYLNWIIKKLLDGGKKS